MFVSLLTALAQATFRAKKTTVYFKPNAGRSHYENYETKFPSIGDAEKYLIFNESCLLDMSPADSWIEEKTAL